MHASASMSISWNQYEKDAGLPLAFALCSSVLSVFLAEPRSFVKQTIQLLSIWPKDLLSKGIFIQESGPGRNTVSSRLTLLP